MSTGGPKAIIFTSDKTPFSEKEKVVYSNLYKLKQDINSQKSQDKYQSNFDRMSLIQQRRFLEFCVKKEQLNVSKLEAAYEGALNKEAAGLAKNLRFV